jgi:hypothetical protein
MNFIKSGIGTRIYKSLFDSRQGQEMFLFSLLYNPILALARDKAIVA